MIEFINVYKSFGKKIILDNFNTVIQDGEFVVLRGRSGCGKSTLLNLIGGLEKPDKGEICIDGRPLSKQKNREWILREKVGFLFQNFALVDTKTVMENMELIYRNCRSSFSAEEALDRVGLSEKVGEKVYKLSGGEQQRVAIARLIYKKCDIILADEPTASLDLENAENIIGLLRKLNKTGKTIIMATHDSRLCDCEMRVIELSNT